MHVRAILVALLLTASARADDGAVSGFVATGSGELSGHATDADGKPLVNVEIHVVSKSGGEQIYKTDKQGNYKVVLKGAQSEESMIFVRGHLGAHIGGSAAVPTKIDGNEAIEIRETLPPAVLAKPVLNVLVIPEYTEAAIDDDVWTRTWMLLDIDDAGVVRHLKLLQRPGHGLDDIAIREGFKVRFEPARDRAKRPIPSMMMWTFEWPSYSWLIEHHEGITRMPGDYSLVTCQKPGEHHATLRDCSQPDVKATLQQSWISPKLAPAK
jgi:hypothetical protein